MIAADPPRLMSHSDIQVLFSDMEKIDLVVASDRLAIRRTKTRDVVLIGEYHYRCYN
jgi:hypothetical protein